MSFGRQAEVTYELGLPPSFSTIHLIFYISMLCRYILDNSHVLQYDTVEFDDRLTYIEESVAI